MKQLSFSLPFSSKVGEYIDFVKEEDEKWKAVHKEDRYLVSDIQINTILPKVKAYCTKSTETESTWIIVTWADLCRYSGYSLLEATNRLSDIITATETVGGLTDTNVLHGMVAYTKGMKKEQKHAIIGMHTFVSHKEGLQSVVFLVKNAEGYKNLSYLSKYIAQKEGSIPSSVLKEKTNGLIAILTNTEEQGGIAEALYRKNTSFAQEKIVEWKDLFQDDLYMGVFRHETEHMVTIEKKWIQLAKEMDISYVALTGSRYKEKEDVYLLQTVRMIKKNDQMGKDTEAEKIKEKHQYMHTGEMIEERFRDMPEAILCTLEIAAKCADFELNLSSRYMPTFDVPTSFTESSYFVHLCWKGFEERFKGTKKDNETYKKRLSYEISVIEKMGFEGYFLIVWDFVRFAKEQGILVGPGRGSVVGSLVAYCLRITELDPIRYGLLFERFLNPERVSMPDIDMDFQDDRREEVIDYVKTKYGEETVAKIVTFGTLAAKNSIKDVGKVLNYPYPYRNEISKMIPDKPGMTIKKAMEINPDFKALYENDHDAHYLIDLAQKIEGLPKNCSQHACGVVIAPHAVYNYLPVVMVESEDGLLEQTTQVVMTEVEELGLLKMDFLGLKTMTVIAKALEMVNEKRKKQKEKPLDYLSIPLNDKKVYEDIGKGETYGVFQLESPGMRKFMEQLYKDASTLPDNSNEFFERLIAGISLYRPGPMDSIPAYLENIANPNEIAYEHPSLEPILKNTYGQIVYQEQVMQIVQQLGGYSLGRADLVRRAMGKKKKDIMLKEKDVFIEGTKKLNIPLDVATSVWDKMVKFAEYAFNKSHAGAYAMLGVLTAWIRYYYPTEFMIACLNTYVLKRDKLEFYLKSCKKMNIPILPPDIQQSDVLFSIEEESKIRFGLQGIAQVGKTAKQIVQTRQCTAIKDIQDFIDNMFHEGGLREGALDALIFSGALDCFGYNRRSIYDAMPTLMNEGKKVKEDANKGQITLFDLSEDLKEWKKVQIEKKKEFPLRYLLENEKKYMGIYLSGHPLDDFKKELKKEKIDTIEEIEYEIVDANNHFAKQKKHPMDGEKVTVVGMIQDLKTFYTKKNNNPLHSFLIEDETGEMKTVMFHQTIEEYGLYVEEGEIVWMEGKIGISESFGVQIIATKLLPIKEALEEKKMKEIWIRTDDSTVMNELRVKARKIKGDLPIFVYVPSQKKAFQLHEQVKMNMSFFQYCQNKFGADFKVKYE